MAAMYKGDDLHPPQPFRKEPGPEPDEAFAALRKRQDELDEAIKQKKADVKEKADFFAEVLASDPPRFRAILGLQTEGDYAAEAARAELLETWHLAKIKAARLAREAHNG